MKVVKSILALAMAVLLGSSAWAKEITLKVGETYTASASKGSTTDGGRWWMFTGGTSATASEATALTAAALEIVDIAFVDASGNPTPGSYSGVPNMSATHVVQATYTITGKKPGTTTIQLFGTTPPSSTSDEVPQQIPTSSPWSHVSGASGNWSSSNLTTDHQLVITVSDPTYEAVTMTTEDTSVVKNGSSDVAGNWSCAVTEGSDVVTADIAPNANSYTLTLSPLAAGAATVVVMKGATRVMTYTVTVKEPTPEADEKYHLCKGETVQLSYRSNSGSGNNWTASITGSGASADPTTGTQRNFSTTVTANGEGAAHIKVTHTRNSSTTTYDDSDVVIGEKRVVYMGKTKQYYLYSYNSREWATPTYSPANVVTVANGGTTASKDNIITVTPIKVGATTVTVNNVGGTGNIGATYTLKVEVRDVLKADGDVPGFQLEPGAKLSTISVTDLVTMKDTAGNAVTGEFAWENGDASFAESGSYTANVIFTAKGENAAYYDQATIAVPVMVVTPKAEHDMGFVNEGKALLAGGQDPVELKDSAWGGSWTCQSLNADIADCDEDDGTLLIGASSKAGKATIWVENDTDRWIYYVKVYDTVSTQLANAIYLNESATFDCESPVEGETWTATSADTDSVSVSMDGDKATFVGLKKTTAPVTVTIKNDYRIYTIAVEVTDEKPAETGKINLALGDTAVMSIFAVASSGGQPAARKYNVAYTATGMTVTPSAEDTTTSYETLTLTYTPTANSGSAELTTLQRRTNDGDNWKDVPDADYVKSAVSTGKRIVYVGSSKDLYVYSFLAGAWTVTPGSQNIEVTATPEGAVKQGTVTVSGKAVGAATLVADNTEKDAAGEFYNGVKYNFAIEVRDTPVVAGAVAAGTTIKVGDKLSTITTWTGTIKGSNGETLTGTFAWKDGDTTFDEVGPTNAPATFTVTEGENKDFYDQIDVDVAVDVVSAGITVTIAKGEGIADVQTNGVSAVGELKLPADTTEIELKLVAAGDLKIPVYKLTEGKDALGGSVTSATPKLTDLKDGDYYTFTAVEGNTQDPTVSDEEAKKALIAAAGEESAAKVDAVVGDDVSAKELNGWIIGQGLDAKEALAGDFVKASCLLGVAPIDETASLAISAVTSSSQGNGLDITVKVGDSDVTAKAKNAKVSAKGTKGTENVDLVLNQDGDKLVVKPVDDTVSAYIVTITIESDDGSKKISSQKFGVMTKVVAADVRALVAVPFKGVGEESDISIDDLFVADTLVEGTVLQVYNGGSYDAWRWSGSAWEKAVTLLKAAGGLLSSVPDDKALTPGMPVWVENKGDQPLKLKLIGDVVENAKVEVGDEKWNLVNLPGITDFDFAADKFETAPTNGDQILVPQAGKEPILYTFDGTDWTYSYKETVTVFNKQMTKVVTGKVSDGGDLAKVPVGSGMWYVKAAK